MKNYKELHIGSTEPLHIFELVCFGLLLYIQVEPGWESFFLYSLRGFLWYHSHYTQP